MLSEATIKMRLKEMRTKPAPETLWDETCDGSARALIVFVGPSPGGTRKKRRPMKKACKKPLWDMPFDEPLHYKKSPGFRASFQPLVEAIFENLRFDTAGKLIARANLDWIQNPNAKEVPEERMLEGAPSTLRLLQDCSPELILPMGSKAFQVLKKAFRQNGYDVSNRQVEEFSVRISEKSKRHHRKLHAFSAANPDGCNYLVMKLPQHPARMFSPAYGARCGKALRKAAMELAAHMD